MLLPEFVEVDIKNAAYSILCQQMEMPAIVRDYRDRRDEVQKEVKQALTTRGAVFKKHNGLKQNGLKQLFLSMLFGGSVWNWMDNKYKYKYPKIFGGG